MADSISLSLVRCSNSADQHSEIIQTTLSQSNLQQQLIEATEQVLEADLARGLHLAAEDPKHGTVTYLQEVTKGGFFVYVGKPDALEEHWFGPGEWVAFNDHTGTGHASKVGPEGCVRTFRLLRGELQHEG